MDFKYLKNFMDDLSNKLVPGNSAVVYLGGEKVFEYSSGYSDLENKIKMNGSEYLNIYSCSKVTTVVAALQLFEQGKFLMSDPLASYIPEFAEMTVTHDGITQKAKNPITVQNLFNMTAGFTYDLNSPSILKAIKETNGKADTLEVIRALANEPLSFEPGERWQYSLCHDVLAGLVEVISGKRFSEYVKENIFMPLGMEKSFYHTNDKILKTTAQQYKFVPGNNSNESFDAVEAQKHGSASDGVFVNVGKENSGFILGENYDSGGAGIVTTVGDYALLCAALANYGTGLTGEKILSKPTVNFMRENTLGNEQLKSMNWQQLIGYGYGYGVRTLIDKVSAGSVGSIGEFGWGGAAGATVLVDPECNLGVFYAHHMLNPQEEYYQPRLRNVVYSCIYR